MENKCSTFQTSDFEKCLKHMGKAKSEKLLEKIKELERMENDYSLIPDGKNSAEGVFGKRLNISKNTYSLEMGSDRALAVVIEKDGKKIFAWFWSGSHEDYNKKLKSQSLHKNENSIKSNQSDKIEATIKELKTAKNTVVDNIKKTRCSVDNYHNYENYKCDKYKRARA